MVLPKRLTRATLIPEPVQVRKSEVALEFVDVVSHVEDKAPVINGNLLLTAIRVPAAGRWAVVRVVPRGQLRARWDMVDLVGPLDGSQRAATERGLRFWRALSFALNARIRRVWPWPLLRVVPIRSEGKEELVAGRLRVVT